jgi:hypothetical protein
MTTTTTTTTEVADVAADTTDSPPVVEARRWALRPLLSACGLASPAGLAAELGISRDNVTAAGRRGLSDRQADEWAIRVGLHPVLVWGWDWVTAASPETARPQDRVAHELRHEIEHGHLAPGHPLPAVKALAERFGVAVNTVCQATAELQRERLVHATGQGRPLVVTDRSRLACQPCAHCGNPIDPGDEHYPHRPDCTQAGSGWCDCDQATHPRCCPTCGSRR